jgi:hypothetical protein
VRPSVYKRIRLSWAPMAHTYNPSYTGSRDEENHGSKPAWANSSMRPFQIYSPLIFIKSAQCIIDLLLHLLMKKLRFREILSHAES